MAIISKFLASKWVTVALILALAGGAYYVYSQGKMLGGAKEKLEAYEVTIAQQEAANKRLIEENTAKDEALTSQTKSIQRLRSATRMQQLAVMEAKKHADKVTRECMALHLADGLQFGPSRQDGDSEDKARSNMDG